MPFMPKGEPQPRKDVIELLEKDARILARKGDQHPIQLSFTCDPYQMIDEQYQLTRQALQVLLGYGLHVQILTKGGNRSIRDFVSYQPIKILSNTELRLSSWMIRKQQR